jgi:hypothetical protein
VVLSLASVPTQRATGLPDLPLQVGGGGVRGGVLQCGVNRHTKADPTESKALLRKNEDRVAQHALGLPDLPLQGERVGWCASHDGLWVSKCDTVSFKLNVAQPRTHNMRGVDMQCSAFSD